MKIEECDTTNFFNSFNTQNKNLSLQFFLLLFHSLKKLYVKKKIVNISWISREVIFLRNSKKKIVMNAKTKFFLSYSCHARYYYESKLSAKKIRWKLAFEKKKKKDLTTFWVFVILYKVCCCWKEKPRPPPLLKSYPPFSQLYFFALRLCTSWRNKHLGIYYAKIVTIFKLRIKKIQNFARF